MTRKPRTQRGPRGIRKHPRKLLQNIDSGPRATRSPGLLNTPLTIHPWKSSAAQQPPVRHKLLYRQQSAPPQHGNGATTHSDLQAPSSSLMRARSSRKTERRAKLKFNDKSFFYSGSHPDSQQGWHALEWDEIVALGLRDVIPRCPDITRQDDPSNPTRPFADGCDFIWLTDGEIESINKEDGEAAGTIANEQACATSSKQEPQLAEPRFKSSEQQKHPTWWPKDCRPPPEFIRVFKIHNVKDLKPDLIVWLNRDTQNRGHLALILRVKWVTGEVEVLTLYTYGDKALEEREGEHQLHVQFWDLDSVGGWNSQTDCKYPPGRYAGPRRAPRQPYQKYEAFAAQFKRTMVCRA